MSSATAASHRLTPSETVYFHAAAFARERSLLDSAELVYTDQKVRANDLADALLAAAFLGAESAGAVRLSIDKKSALFGLRKVDTLFVEATGKPHDFPEGTFEAQIVALAGKRRDARGVIVDLLREDAPSPQAWTIQLVVQGLARRGVLATGEKKVLKLLRTTVYEMTPQAEGLAATARPEPVKALLEHAANERPEVWTHLAAAMKSALAFRRETSDAGPD